MWWCEGRASCFIHSDSLVSLLSSREDKDDDDDDDNDEEFVSHDKSYDDTIDLELNVDDDDGLDFQWLTSTSNISNTSLDTVARVSKRQRVSRSSFTSTEDYVDI